jgi:hypothetical protein
LIGVAPYPRDVSADDRHLSALKELASSRRIGELSGREVDASIHHALTETGGGYCVDVRTTDTPQIGQKCCPPVTERQTYVERRRFSVTSRTASGGTYQCRNPVSEQIEQLQSKSHVGYGPRESHLLARRPVQRRHRLPPERLVSLVDLEPRQLELLHDTRGEHLAGAVWRMLLEDSAQQTTAAGHER